MGWGTLGHFLSFNFSHRVNSATVRVKGEKKPPTSSAFSVTAEPINVVFAHTRSESLLQAERFSNFNVNKLRWRRSIRSSVHHQQVNKSQTNPGPLVSMTLWFPWHFKTLDMLIFFFFSGCMSYWSKNVCVLHSWCVVTDEELRREQTDTWRRTTGTDCAHRNDIKQINPAHTHTELTIPAGCGDLISKEKTILQPKRWV